MGLFVFSKKAWEKNMSTQHFERIKISNPRAMICSMHESATSSWIANMDTRVGFRCPVRNVMMDSISLTLRCPTIRDEKHFCTAIKHQVYCDVTAAPLA